jgi:multidrug efflux system membrane fusion protein
LHPPPEGVQGHDFMSPKETVNEGNTDGNTPPTFFRRWWILLLLVVLLAFGIYAILGKFGRTQTRGADPERKASSFVIPVAAVPAHKKDFNLYITGLGTVTPVKTVTVRTLVDGQLMEVLFEEGQTVRRGDLMARIDPRPFEVQLLQAEGQMARDLAQLKNAQVDLERYKVLWGQDSVAKQQLDTQEALIRQFEGAIKTDEGQIQSAKLQLIYSRITAPISGRVGLRLVDPGNIVHTSDVNGLVVITQLQPITVVFSIPEDSLPPVLAALKAGKRLPVEAFNREQTKKLATGSLLTVDNQIDPTTGTVRLKATFDNQDNELFPNQFVNARLLIDVIKDAIVAPSVAIQRGPQGPYMYVVKPDRTVTIHPITVGEIQGGEVSVDSGLSEGDLVVVDGAERLREGVKVELKGQNHDSGKGSGQ